MTRKTKRKNLRPEASSAIPVPDKKSNFPWRYVAIGSATVALIALLITGLFKRVEGPPDDIILVTIDTLRADCVGYARDSKVRTPFLERIASEGRVFTNAHAHNVVTLPSHVNILTGLYPYQHGVRENAGFTLDPKHKTLGTIFRDAGFATGAFVSAYPLDARFGLNAGFDVYDDRYREASAPLDFTIQERPADETMTAARDWFDKSDSKRRFLWVHLYEPHAPYQPPPQFRALYPKTPYLGEIAAVDDALERFIAPMLRSRRRVLMIVTADHGEALGDHGEQTHGLFAYESTLKVPLIVWDSARKKGSRDERYVRHVDILPTFLEQAGLKKSANLPGRSLFESGEPGDTYFEALSASLNRGWAPLVGIISGNRKYIDLPLPELYDLISDPAEKANLVGSDRRALFALRKRLIDAAPGKAAAGRQVSTEEQARLLSLGYLTGTAAKKTYTVADDPKNLVDLDSQLHQLVALYQGGRISQALAVARDLVAKRGDMQIAREMLAFLLQQSERPEDAARTLEADVKTGRATDSMKIRLGLILAESGRAAEAAQLLRPFAAQNDPSILNAYAIALADSGDLPGASRAFEKVLTIDSTNAKAYQGLGVVALRAGRMAEANQYLLKSLELNDRMPLSLNTLGVIRAREGRVDEAMALWTKAIEVDPRQYDAMFNLAILATRNGRSAVALKALTQFIQTAPPARYGGDLQKARRLVENLEASRRENQ